MHQCGRIVAKSQFFKYLAALLPLELSASLASDLPSPVKADFEVTRAPALRRFAVCLPV